MPAEQTHAEIVAALTSRWPEHRPAPSLGRIQALTELLGDPQRVYPVIHLTGTNGKGSTAAMIESLLRADGLRTGRFTSPHVTSVTERITIDGQPISDERFDEVWREIEPYVEFVDERQIDGVSMTFFEIITAMAYAAFADAPVDVAIVEVGLGGAWDATNVADADVAVVTPIDLDHTNLLGRTITEIAREKAGIIKPGAHAILAGQTLEAAQILLARCAEVGALPQREGIDFGVIDRQLAVAGQLIRLSGADGPVDDIFLPFYGAHQAANAAQALAATEAFLGLKALDPDVVRRGVRPGPLSWQVGTGTPLAGGGARRSAQPARCPSGCSCDHRGLRLRPADRRCRGHGGQGCARHPRSLRGDHEPCRDHSSRLDHRVACRLKLGGVGRGDLRRLARDCGSPARRRDRAGGGTGGGGCRRLVGSPDQRFGDCDQRGTHPARQG